MKFVLIKILLNYKVGGKDITRLLGSVELVKCQKMYIFFFYGEIDRLDIS